MPSGPKIAERTTFIAFFLVVVGVVAGGFQHRSQVRGGRRTYRSSLSGRFFAQPVLQRGANRSDLSLSLRQRQERAQAFAGFDDSTPKSGRKGPYKKRDRKSGGALL